MIEEGIKDTPDRDLNVKSRHKVEYTSSHGDKKLFLDMTKFTVKIKKTE